MHPAHASLLAVPEMRIWIRLTKRMMNVRIQPTAAPSVSLITCTGLWLPQLNDYAERLVVRAELMSS